MKLAFLFSVFLFSVFSYPFAYAQEKVLSNTVVIIDPGHGGADPGCPFVVKVGNKVVKGHYEAAYTYLAAEELAKMVRDLGGKTYLTCNSKTVKEYIPKNAQDPRPLPRDAVFSDTDTPVTKSRSGGLRHRASFARKIYEENSAHNIFFISLHVDALPNGNWKGTKVLYLRGNNTPDIAHDISKAADTYGCPRTKDGIKQKQIESKNLGVLRNGIPESCLVEMCVPGNPNDSWRIRNDSNRKNFLRGVITKGLVWSALPKNEMGFYGGDAILNTINDEVPEPKTNYGYGKVFVLIFSIITMLYMVFSLAHIITKPVSEINIYEKRFAIFGAIMYLLVTPYLYHNNEWLFAYWVIAFLMWRYLVNKGLKKAQIIILSNFWPLSLAIFFIFSVLGNPSQTK